MQLIKEIYWRLYELIYGRVLERPSNFEVIL